MKANMKELTLESGRKVTIKALGMLTLRNLRGHLPVVARDESTPDAPDAVGSEDEVDRGINFVCAACVKPNFVNTLEPADGETSVDELSISEFSELAMAIKRLSGIDDKDDKVVPLSRTGKA